MESEYEILETWQTSLGLIASIKFSNNGKPEIGKKIIYNNKSYSIIGVITHSSPAQSNIELQKRMADSIYNCSLKIIEE